MTCLPTCEKRVDLLYHQSSRKYMRIKNQGEQPSKQAWLLSHLNRARCWGIELLTVVPVNFKLNS